MNLKLNKKMRNENKRSIESVVADSELLYCENFVNAMLIFDVFFFAGIMSTSPSFLSRLFVLFHIRYFGDGNCMNIHGAFAF